MTQSNTSSPRRLEVLFQSQRRVMAIEISQYEEISGVGKNGEKKQVGFAIRRRRANRRSINIKERE